MKTYRVWETLDGKVHRSREEAVRHADNLFGNLLLDLSHRLCQVENLGYRKVSEFLENNLPEFQRLLGFKKGCEMEGEDEEGPY